MAPETLPEVPVKDKYLLTMYEAAAYFHIGINRMSELCKQPGNPFVFYSGTKKLVKRQVFEDFIINNQSLDEFKIKSIKPAMSRKKPACKGRGHKKIVATTDATE